MFELPWFQPKAGTRIRLRIKIHNQYALAKVSEAGTKIHRSRRLANAAFLIGDSKDTSIPGGRHSFVGS